ncbi:MAG: hypothetical protein ABIB43_01500 [archaeon]
MKKLSKVINSLSYLVIIVISAVLLFIATKYVQFSWQKSISSTITFIIDIIFFAGLFLYFASTDYKELTMQEINTNYMIKRYKRHRTVFLIAIITTTLITCMSFVLVGPTNIFSVMTIIFLIFSILMLIRNIMVIKKLKDSKKQIESFQKKK